MEKHTSTIIRMANTSCWARKKTENVIIVQGTEIAVLYVARNKSVSCAVAASSITAYHSVLIMMPCQDRTRHCLTACTSSALHNCNNVGISGYYYVLSPTNCIKLNKLDNKEHRYFCTKVLFIGVSYCWKDTVSEPQTTVFHNNENGPFVSRIYRLAINKCPDHPEHAVQIQHCSNNVQKKMRILHPHIHFDFKLKNNI